MSGTDDTLLAPSDAAPPEARPQSLRASSSCRGSHCLQDLAALEHALIVPSMRAFKRAHRDACTARHLRARAAYTPSPRHRAMLILAARQCEARVRFMADQALRGAR
jgi:hypothetical protein